MVQELTPPARRESRHWLVVQELGRGERQAVKTVEASGPIADLPILRAFCDDAIGIPKADSPATCQEVYERVKSGAN